MKERLNAEQIKEELKRLDSIPTSQVSEELSKLRMYYSDWREFTNTEVRKLNPYVSQENNKELYDMYNNEKLMSYNDFCVLCNGHYGNVCTYDTDEENMALWTKIHRKGDPITAIFK